MSKILLGVTVFCLISSLSFSQNDTSVESLLKNAILLDKSNKYDEAIEQLDKAKNLIENKKPKSEYHKLKNIQALSALKRKLIGTKIEISGVTLLVVYNDGETANFSDKEGIMNVHYSSNFAEKIANLEQHKKCIIKGTVIDTGNIDLELEYLEYEK